MNFDPLSEEEWDAIRVAFPRFVHISGHRRNRKYQERDAMREGFTFPEGTTLPEMCEIVLRERRMRMIEKGNYRDFLDIYGAKLYLNMFNTLSDDQKAKLMKRPPVIQSRVAWRFLYKYGWIKTRKTKK
ncbi:hypothetical protein [Candidatus Hodarchaeum mangrovi]